MSLPAINLRKSIFEKLEGRPIFRKAVGNLGWLFSDRLLRAIIGAFITCWITRELGPSQYGLLSWANAWTSIFNLLAVLGLDSIVVRDIVKFPEEKNSILGTAFVMKVVGGVLALTLAVGMVSFVRPHLQTNQHLLEVIVSLYATAGIFQAFDTIDFWYQSQIASRYVVQAKSVVFVLMSGTRLWLLHVHAPAIAYATAALADVVLGAIGLYVTYRYTRNSMLEWRYDSGWMKSLLADSWPVMLGGVAIMIQARIDQVMLGFMVGKAEVGQFSVAVGAIEALGFLPMIVYSTTAPLIVKAKAMGEEIYYARLCDVYRLMFLLFLVTGVPLFFLAKPIAVSVLGPKYLEAGQLLSLMCIRIFFANFGVARGAFVMSENLFRYTLVTAIAGTIVNVGLNLLLIPHFHAVGSVWAMTASFFVTIFLLDGFYPPVRRNFNAMIRAIVTPWKVSLS